MSIHRSLAESVLREQRRPLTPAEILELVRASGRVTEGFGGSTPARSMAARLAESIRAANGEGTFVRHSPGRFFLRDLLEDPTVPSAFRRSYASTPRTARREPRLAIPAASLPRTNVLIPPREILDLLDEGCFEYSDAAASLHADLVAVRSFVIVTSGGRLLTHRKTGRGTKRRRSLGFSAPVEQDDRTLFDRDEHGITESALRSLRITLGPARSFTVRGHGAPIARLDGFLLTTGAAGTNLLGLMRFDAGEAAIPFSRRHGIKDLRLEDPAEIREAEHLLERESAEVLRSLLAEGVDSTR